MFGFGRKAKLQKAIDRALAPVDAEDDLADHAPIEALPADMQAEGFGRVALALFRDERYAPAKHSLERALAIAPDEVELHDLAASIAAELDDVDAAIAARRRGWELKPREPDRAAALAGLLMAVDRVDEAIALLEPLRKEQDPTIEARLAEALFVVGRHQEALDVLDPVCAYYEAQLKQLTAGDWQALKDRAEHASRLRDEVYAELHGREATIELHAAAGRLDARAGINYRLLGAQLAAKSERIADVLELEDPDATERRGRALLDAKPPRTAAGLVLVGCAQLRRGEVSAAHETFERACEADGRCFAAFLGLGAAMDHDRHGLHRRANKLAMPKELPPVLAKVVPDFAVLTDPERRVVWASAQPLAKLLPVLAERGVTMRILPIDVRATDIGLFEDAAGERAEDDHRSYDALSGVATHGGAVAKIEELLDTVSGAGWTFAHELAHLAFFHMEEDDAAPLVSLYERALDVGYANIDYALSNIDEFFAVGYADYLREKHGATVDHVDDETGIHAGLTAYFDALSAG